MWQPTRGWSVSVEGDKTVVSKRWKLPQMISETRSTRSWKREPQTVFGLPAMGLPIVGGDSSNPCVYEMALCCGRVASAMGGRYGGSRWRLGP